MLVNDNDKYVEMLNRLKACKEVALDFETLVYPMADWSFEQQDFSNTEEMEKRLLGGAAPAPGAHINKMPPGNTLRAN